MESKAIAIGWHCESGAREIALCLNPLRMICRVSSKVPLWDGVMPIELFVGVMSSCYAP